MKFRNLLYGCAFVVSVASCSDDPSNASDNNGRLPITLSKSESEVVYAGNEFAWNLIDVANSEFAGKNICMSPTSASITLTMLLNAANGDTRSEIIDALGLKGMSVDDINENSRFLVNKLQSRDRGCTLYSANSVWMDESLPLKSEYQLTLADYFNATAQNTNCANFVKDVNAWCSEKTKGLIPNFLNDSEKCDWALINAMYFQCKWNSSVGFEDAGPSDFTNYDGSRNQVPFMSTKDAFCRYSQGDLSKTAHIPFGNGAYVMSVTLPNEGVSIEECIGEIKEDIEAFYNAASVYMEITMPKFKIDHEYDMVDALKVLGIRMAFDQDVADLTNASEMRSYVEIFKQKCNFEVDEEGATAVAVSVSGEGYGSYVPETQPKPMVVNRPFLFTIYEYSTHCTLFAGKIESL